MIISLIGMSGTGKTHWSRALEKHGFLVVHCDELIEKKLEEELKKIDFHGLRDVADWMGQPFHKEYPETSKKYLQFEKEVMEEVLSTIDTLPKDKDIVIDTTGSIIYLDGTIHEDLKKKSRIIFLDVPPQVKDDMYKLYMRDPKPVIWGDIYKQKGNESNYVALSRCYPQLLEYRSKKYKELAHLTLDYYELRKNQFQVTDFLKLVSV